MALSTVQSRLLRGSQGLGETSRRQLQRVKACRESVERPLTFRICFCRGSTATAVRLRIEDIRSKLQANANNCRSGHGVVYLHVMEDAKHRQSWLMALSFFTSNFHLRPLSSSETRQLRTLMHVTHCGSPLPFHITPKSRQLKTRLSFHARTIHDPATPRKDRARRQMQ